MVKSSRGEDLGDLLDALPEHLVGEIVQGELVVSPRPAPRHALASFSIGGELFHAFGRGGWKGWWILAEPELHLDSDVLVPDVAGWRRERMPAMPKEACFPIAPDWVCEVLSPRTAAVDRVRKMPIYAREGVAHIWLVDPQLRTLEVYLLKGSQWVLVAAHVGDETVCVPPFEEVPFDLSLWWVPESEADPARRDLDPPV